MTSDATTGGSQRPGGLVMRRLLARRDESRAPQLTAVQRAGEDNADRAAGIALGRAAERTHGLPVFARDSRLTAMSVAEINELLPERALLAIVEDRQGRVGFVALCQNLLASMIEMQALGRVTPRPVQSRRPTRTDAAIAADFVNALLEELARELPRNPDTPRFDSFRYVAYLDDPRPLGLMLEDGELFRLSLGFRIGTGGQRDGTVLLGLPGETAQRRALPSAPALTLAGSTPATPAAPLEKPTLAASVREAPVTLSGVLCRRTMTLRALRNLQPGAVIPLPGNALDDIRVETLSGQLLARGRLGENDGFHAIKLRPADAVPSGAELTDRLADHRHAPARDAASMPQDLDMPDPFRDPATVDSDGLSALRRSQG